MSNFEHCRLEAIKRALELVSKWGDINCLINNAHRFCNARKEDFEAIRELRKEGASDECLKETMRIAGANYGATNLLSAFYFINGNYIQSDIWYARHIHSMNRILNRKDELNDMEDAF
ncbi:hypothetical protein NIES4071_106110 (plasmid) [Calothrix sp. NIES-4071]|nr:hypothetical protein NIES4071_106110 [Calothrix sp. NIES-4071]BAZ65029.1 hypothetical protein NIES4105_107620 [Calothrix sp. NIES-4105]